MSDLTRNRRPLRRVALCLSTILVSGLAAPAFAQSATAPEPYRNADEFGVDLVSGTFNLGLSEGDIGQGATALSMMRYWGQAGWTDNWSGYLREAKVGTQWFVTITAGGTSEKFTRSGSAYVSQKSKGGTLTASVNAAGFSVFLYTTADGTKIEYAGVGQTAYQPNDSPPNKISVSGNSGTCVAAPSAPNAPGTATAASPTCAVPSQITQTNGVKVKLNWGEAFYCYDQGGDVWVCDVSYRLESMAHSNGYFADISYASGALGAVNYNTNDANFAKRSTVKLINRATVYCDPSALDCTATGSWPTVTYAFPAANTQDVTLENGGTWRFTFANNRMTSVRRPGAAAATTTISYFTDGRVSSVTKDGATKNYTWTGTATTTVATTTGGGETATVISTPTAAQPTSTVNATSNTTTYLYDSFTRKTRETRPEGDYTNWTYDARGNVTEARSVAKAGSGLADIVTTANYDTTCTNITKCNQPNFVIDPKGNRTDYTYDATHGGVTRVQLPAATLGGVRPETNYVYATLYPQVRDAGGALINAPDPEYKVTQITACSTAATCAGTVNETKVTIAYATPNLLPTSVTTAAGNDTLSATSTLTYDGANNLKTQDGPLPGPDDTVTYFYDAQNRQRGTIGPDPDGVGARPRGAMRLTFDAQSRVTKTEIGTATGTAEADLTAMTVAETVDTVFDANGNAVRQTLSSGGTAYALTQYSYDVDNRLLCTAVRMNPAVYASLPASACTTSTLNTANGPDRITKALYDANGRVTKVQTAFGAAEQADEVTSTFSANGQVETVKDGENNLTTYYYDGHDRVLKTLFPDKVTKNLTSLTDYEQYTYDPNGNVVQRRLRDGTSIFSAYDNLNRLWYKDLPVPDTDAVYTYDLLGRMTSAAQNGQTLTLGYDALSRNTSVAGPLGTLSYQYDVAGRRTRLTYPDAFYVTTDYDVTGNVTAIRDPSTGSGGASSLLATYAYDNLGRRTSLTRGNGAVTSWSYDPVSRVSNWTDDLSPVNAGGGSDRNVTFTWNPASGIASSTRDNDAYAWGQHYNVNRNYSVNGLNQLTAAGATALGYDGRGSLTSSGSSAYSYSSENLLLTGPNSASLAYDPAMRLYQSVGAGITTRFGYDGVDLIGEYNSSNTLLRRYVHGPGTDEPLVWYEGSGTTDRRWLHADERGSVVAISNASGTVTNINAYDEFGIPAPTNVGRFQFTGQTWLPEIGLYYYKARLYSPTLGRFMQTDPIGYGDGMNIYNYVGSDPVNMVDPTGLRLIVTGPRCRPHNRDACPKTDMFLRQYLVEDHGRNGGQPQVDNSGGEAPCPDVPAEVPGYVYIDPGVMIQSSIVRDAAVSASNAMYPTLEGVDDEKDAYRHVFGAAMLARGVGGSRALGGLNGNELQGIVRGWFGAKGYTVASRKMDYYNNFVGVSMATDPRFSKMSAKQIADYAASNGCLATAP